MKRFFVAALTFAAVYLAASALSRLLSPAPSDFATFWIASGVYLAALLRTDMDRWPGMVTGAFVANVAFAALWIGRSIWVSLAFSTANGVEAVLGAALVLRCCRRRAIERFDLSWGGGLLRLVAAVCLFSTIVSAVIGAAVSVMAYGGDFSPAAVTWWVSDAIGVLVISPILLVSPAQWADARAGLAGRGLVEAGALTAGLVALAWFIFWRASPAMEWTYLILPVLLWITLRFRLPGVAIGMVLLSVIAVLGTIRGHGVYSEYLAADAATSLQALLAVVSICFLSLAAAVTQAHDASRRLDALNHSLAAEVARQTASLTTAATRLRLALHGAEMGTWQWTVGTTEAVLDERQRDLLDLDPDASPSADAIYARLHPDDVARIRREFEAWVATGGLWAYEHRLIDRRGATRWIGGRAALVHDPDGRRVATGVTFDITRQKHDEDARLEAERQLRRFADSAPATLWASDPAGAATFRSRDWYHLTGRPPREAGRDWIEAVHPADRDAVVRALGAAHERREPFRAEYRVRLASGAYGWVLDAARPLFGGDGTFLGLVGSVVDISALKRAADDQRRAEAALRESDVRFRQLADHLDAGLWILEAETARLGYVSSGFRRVWDVAPEALRSRDDWNALIHPEDRRRVAEAFAAFLADRADFLVEYPHRSSVGRGPLGAGPRVRRGA